MPLYSIIVYNSKSVDLICEYLNGNSYTLRQAQNFAERTQTHSNPPPTDNSDLQMHIRRLPVTTQYSYTGVDYVEYKDRLASRNELHSNIRTDWMRENENTGTLLRPSSRCSCQTTQTRTKLEILGQFLN